MLEEFGDIPGGQRDLIGLGAVLEHINEPVEVLRQLNSKFKEGGHIFVRVLDFLTFSRDSVGDIFPVEHPNMFPEESLDFVLQQSGCSHIASTRHEGGHGTQSRFTKRYRQNRLLIRISLKKIESYRIAPSPRLKTMAYSNIQ